MRFTLRFRKIHHSPELPPFYESFRFLLCFLCEPAMSIAGCDYVVVKSIESDPIAELAVFRYHQPAEEREAHLNQSKISTSSASFSAPYLVDILTRSRVSRCEQRNQ